MAHSYPSWAQSLCLSAIFCLTYCLAGAAQSQSPQDGEPSVERSIIPVFQKARAHSQGKPADLKPADLRNTSLYKRIARPQQEKPWAKIALPKQRKQFSEKTTELLTAKSGNQKTTHMPSLKADASAQAAAPASVQQTVSLDPARNLGVTIWKLQPVGAFADFNQPACRGGARSIGQGAEQRVAQPVMLTPPLRASSETLFRTGDRIRLSIESTREGYLYIINRERYADGTYGTPKLIFPTQRIRGGNNYLAPGSPVEFPDLCDNANYFEFLQPSGEKRPVAEALIMIVTDKPLTEVGAPRDAARIPASWITDWESRWSGQTSVYELDGGEGQPYTTAELNAGFEIRMQGQHGARELGQGSPQPQTLYSVSPRGDGLMTTVFLWYE